MPASIEDDAEGSAAKSDIYRVKDVLCILNRDTS
jgi:hypothetical protein